MVKLLPNITHIRKIVTFCWISEISERGHLTYLLYQFPSSALRLPSFQFTECVLNILYTLFLSPPRHFISERQEILWRSEYLFFWWSVLAMIGAGAGGLMNLVIRGYSCEFPQWFHLELFLMGNAPFSYANLWTMIRWFGIFCFD